MNLDPTKIPSSLHSLLPYAERWGISDDYDRDTVIEEATADERTELIHCADAFETELFGWLAGPESALSPPSREYVAFTNLILAIDYAKALQSE
jgi:hypothetical protein